MQPAAVQNAGASRQAWVNAATHALVVVGIALRLAFFAPADTSLWGDEAALALNLKARSPSQLLGPLDYNQHAPVGFLLTEKLLYEACGLDERCLRLPALVSSVLSLLLFAGLTARVLGPNARWLAVGLFALSPSLVRYAAELKPYSTDVLATVLITAAALDYLRREPGTGRLIAWAISGSVVVWWSFAAVPVLFGVGMALGLRQLWAAPSGVWRLVSVLSVAAMSFMFEHQLVVGDSIRNKELLDFWSVAFVPFPPTSLWDVRHGVTLLTSAFRNPLGLLDTAFPAAIAAIGAAALGRTSASIVLVLVAPIVVTAGFSAMHLWPFAGRLILFLCPLLTILLASGASTLGTLPLGRLPILAVTLAMFAGPVVGMRETLQSTRRSGVSRVLQRLAPQVVDGDVVYVYYKSAATFRLYRPQVLPERQIAVTMGQRIDGNSVVALADIKQLAGFPRVWVILSEVNTYWTDERILVTSMLDRIGQRQASFQESDAFLYLYDLSGQLNANSPRPQGGSKEPQ